ncbi:hypothetical protein CHS0354_042851 [Potamilus streckersoni]|uniref:AAA+ ATPase domain-containing protein n=1 Tax=Potamilus streckersoni TaxID=2493646 RepID=A0AAE0T5Q3_9BIVA|nr:hypothetical protein CHS0354_042851 [Potamilus streckersoni]
MMQQKLRPRSSSLERLPTISMRRSSQLEPHFTSSEKTLPGDKHLTLEQPQVQSRYAAHSSQQKVSLQGNQCAHCRVFFVEFYLFLSSPADSVTLVYKDDKCLNEHKLIPVQNHNKIWTQSVLIPEEKLARGLSYKYKTESSFLSLHPRASRVIPDFVTPALPVLKKQSFLKKACIQSNEDKRIICRDEMENGYTVQGFLEHCSHILATSNTQTINKCTSQLEKMKTSFCLTDACFIIESLGKKIKQGPNKNAVLFAVITINIINCLEIIYQQKLISKDKAQELLQSCKGELVSQLKDSSIKRLTRFFRILCQIIYSGDSSLLRLMHETYPYLSEQVFISEIQADLHNRISLSPPDIDINILKDILLQIFYRVDVAFHNDQLVLLEQLFRHLPTSVALKSFGVMDKLIKPQNNHHKVIYDKVQNVLQKNVIAEVGKVGKKKCLIELSAIWSSLREQEDCAFETRKYLQKEIIQITTTASGNFEPADGKILCELCTDQCLFQEKDDLCSLLRILASSKVEILHDLFITLSLIEKFNISLRGSLELVPKWFQTALDCHLRQKHTKKEEGLCICYEHLNDALALLKLPDDGDCQKQLNNIMLDWLSKLDVKDILKKHGDMEKLAEKKVHVMELYKQHILSLLPDKCKTNQPEEIILSICGASNTLIVNSRPTAVILQNMMCLYGNIFGEDDFENFFRMVEMHRFWKALFTADGQEINLLRGHEIYKKSVDCISIVLDYFEYEQMPWQNFEKLKKLQYATEQNIKDLLVCTCKKNVAEVDKLWNEATSMVKKERKNVKLVRKVLDKTKTKIPVEFFPKEFSELDKYLECMEKRLQEGSCNDSYVREKLKIWYNCEDLPNCSLDLDKYISSDVFWNSCVTVIEKIKENSQKKLEASLKRNEYEEIIGTLFGEHDDVEIEYPRICLLYFKTLYEEGVYKYEENWMRTCKDTDVPLELIVNMFKDCDILEEMKLVEIILGIQICTRESLERFYFRSKYLQQVKIMKDVLPAFELKIMPDSELFDAINQFEGLQECNFGAVTWTEVDDMLKTLMNIASLVSEDCVRILQALAEAPPLIRFLKTVADVDLIDLIESVEELSEQSVNEATVSGLIDVKRFLKPFLNEDIGSNIELFFRNVSEQSAAVNINAFVLKVKECQDNLHNLNSLYKNIANRGEIARKKIDSVNKKGIFLFKIEQEVCLLTVRYAKNKKKKSLTQDNLTDLRSRALMLMNTESNRLSNEEKKMRKQSFEKFVRNVNVASEISQLLTNLHHSGHLMFEKFKEKKNIKDLAALKEDLEEKYFTWCEDLQQCRKNYYYMNFFYGSQIRIFYTFLKSEKGHDKVLTMLRFIHPEIELQDIRKYYCSLDTDGADSTILQNMGLTLEYAVQNLQPVCRMIPKNIEQSTRIEDCVMPGQLKLVALEINSSLVVRNVMALYNNTTKKIPESYQVVFCNQNTTWIELELLLQRCTRTYEVGINEALFCIANVEVLPNDLQFLLVEALRDLPMDYPYLLAIICRGTDNHPFVNEFSDSVSSVHPLSDRAFGDILQQTWPDVLCITSDVPGLGKTETTRQRAHCLGKNVLTLHISGPVHKADLVERLSKQRIKSKDSLHIDIGNVDNPMELDAFLFEIIVLGFSSAGSSFVHLPTRHIFIEIANTVGNQLKDSLQTAVSFSRENLKWQKYDNFIVSDHLNSPVQVVCHYLKALRDETLDRIDLHFTGKRAVKPLETNACKILLQQYFPGPEDMSFTIAKTFINVLADQLKRLSCSVYFRSNTLKAALGSNRMEVKSKLVLALLGSSKEFATRSINSCRLLQVSSLNIASEIVFSPREEYEKEIGLSSEERVQGMIRWEDSNHLIFLFHSQDIQTLSAMYRDQSKVPQNIKDLFERQVRKTLPDYKSMSGSDLQDILQRVARTNPTPLSKTKLEGMAKDYALTPDNLLKMVLIMLRVQAHIPVIIMGETGCGKTSLVWYLSRICGISLKVISIHAGIEEDYLVEKVININKEALNSLSYPVWVFLDEINTCNHLGIICDIVCHHRCLGHSLAPNLVVMAACNPYKCRRHDTILTSGLKGMVKMDELSHLVYRVFPLPEAMVDFVWDFGSINKGDEERYIHRMIQDVFDGLPEMDSLLADLIIMSQKVTRDIEQSESCVSLRDVNRCKLLAKWFPDFLIKLKTKASDTKRDLLIESMILSLAHCYHSRFPNASDRKRYREHIADVFTLNVMDEYTEDKIGDIIIKTQREILSEMEKPTGTAENTALQENVFVILVCILNKIPIFVVGKPGCSKSLSMQIIRSNLRGKDSRNELFRYLPQLYCVSFQGSESSTSDGIIKVFEKAQRYQTDNKNEVLSVVILDEIGLAERSRFNPLKVLHSLLEPEGKQFPDVAVVGISNWALDAAKMNRAIYLSRPEMNEKELIETGKSISKSIEKRRNDAFNEVIPSKSETFTSVELDKELQCVAKSYLQYVKKQTFLNFHGLRDYYSLVKYIARTLSKVSCSSQSEETKMRVIMKGLQRNFGGLPSERSTLHELFQANLHTLQNTDVPVLDLITENIMDEMARHLMLITNGDAALDIVEQELDRLGREKFTIYGSKFEEDQTDEYYYRILNKIIICMEQGLVLILKDLENIYGSLYDMLNQNYTMVGQTKNCRVALGPHSNSLCQVHDEFRCIVFVEESNLNFADPPFLNRFEKQSLKFSDVLSQDEADLIKHLNAFVDKITCIPAKHFTPDDVFPVFGPDMIPSLVHKCYIEMNISESYDIFEEMNTKCLEKLIWIMKPEAMVRLPLSEYGKDNERDVKYIMNDYLKLPIHSGLQSFLHAEISCQNEKCKMIMLFTNSNIYTSIASLLPDIPNQIEKLGVFKSEKQMTQRMKNFWSDPKKLLFVLQCRPFDDGAQILLARNTIERMQKEYQKDVNASAKHVCIILHMDRVDSGTKSLPQINFLTNWKLVMVDSLQRPKMPLPDVLCYNLINIIMDRRPLKNDIKEQLVWAFTRIQYASRGRDIIGIQSIIQQICSTEKFLIILDKFIFSWIEEVSEVDDKNWQIEVACGSPVLLTSSTFNGALENFILEKIKGPIARILFELEKIDTLSTFFLDDACTEVLEVWEKLFTNPEVFSITNTPKPTGAECYICPCPVLNLKVPFFRKIYKKVEHTKQEFLKSLQSIKSAAGIEDTRDVPEVVLQDLVRQHEKVIARSVPEIAMIDYRNWMEDYLHDFNNVTSYEMVKTLPDEERINALKWCLMGKMGPDYDSSPTYFVANMHATVWIHENILHGELQLIELCVDIIKEEYTNITTFLQTIFVSTKIESKEMKPDLQLALEHEDISKEHSLVSKKTNWTLEEEEETNRILETQGKLENMDKNTEVFQNAELPENIVLNDMKENADEKETEVNNGHILNNVEEATSTYTQSIHGLNEGNYDSNNSIQQWELKCQSDTLAVDKEYPLEEVQMADLHGVQKKYNVTEIDDSHDEIEIRHYERLVEKLCIMMLPTEQTLKKFSDISSWHQRASILVSLANQVSINPGTLYAVRLCCDIAVHIVIPLQQMIDMLVNLALLLQAGYALDTQEVRSIIKQLLELYGHKEIRLKLIATYCSRCIGANPDTDIVDWLMDFVAEDLLQSHELVHLKYPIHHAVMTDLSSDQNLSMQILDSEEDFDNIIEISPFLQSIDAFLKKLHARNQTYSPFSAMLVDILEQDIFNAMLKDSEIEALTKYLQYFLQANKILHHEALSLRYVTAVAYIKSFLANFCLYLQEKSYGTANCQVVAQTVNAAMTKSYLMQMFFLKCLGRKTWIYELQRICQKLSNQLSCIGEYEWTKEFNYTCVEASPVSLQVPASISEFFTSFLSANSNELINQLVKKAMSSSENMVCLGGTVLCEIFLKKTLSALNDTDKTRAALVINNAKEEKMETSQLCVLEAFCGTKEMKLEIMQLHEESTCQQKDLAAFIGHLLVILTGFGSANGNPMSFYSTCLMNPQILTELFVPGVPDTKEYLTQLAHDHQDCHHIDEKSGIYYRYFREEEFQSESIAFSAHLQRASTVVKCIPRKGCQQNKCMQFDLRQLSQLTYHVLQCLLYGCLAGSIAVGFSSVEDVSKLLLRSSDESKNTKKLIVETLKEHLMSVSSCLGLEQHNTVVFLHAVLHETKDMLCADTRGMTTVEERSDWEDKFSFRLNSMVKQRFLVVQQVRRKQNILIGLSNDALENLIQEVIDTEEVNEADRIQDLSSEWRITMVPSLNSLLSEIKLEGNEKDFQFLYLVLKNLPSIELIKNIMPILNWHLISVIYASYHLKKKDSFVMRVSDFICRESDDTKRELIKDRFEKYKIAIANIIEKRSVILEFDPDFPELEHVHDDMQLKLCLFDDQHSLTYRVLSTLVDLQNRFIDQTLKIAINAKPLSLNFLRRDCKAEIQCVALSDATSRDIISFEWKDSFLVFSHCDLRYGYGQRILHDFEKIETTLVNSILTNKKYLLIEDDLPTIVYTDECFRNYVHMAQQVKKIINQQPLPSGLVEAVKNKKEKDHRQVSMLLAHTGILMSLLKKTSGDPQTTLVDYVDSWKNILNHPLPKDLLPSPENSIKLCHIVSLHELLEELNAESVIDSLDSRLRVNLNPHTEKKVSEILSRNKDNAEVMLKAVKLFVHRCLSSDDADETQLMISYLGDASFWPTEVVKDGVLRKYGSEVELCALFPDSVKVQNVYQVYKLCKEKVEEHRRNEQHTISLLQSFPSRNKSKEMQSNRRKAAKLYT